LAEEAGRLRAFRLLLDPTRPLALVFVLLSLAVVCAIVPAFLRR
jgi:hypothetical protein